MDKLGWSRTWSMEQVREIVIRHLKPIILLLIVSSLHYMHRNKPYNSDVLITVDIPGQNHIPNSLIYCKCIWPQSAIAGTKHYIKNKIVCVSFSSAN